MVNRDGEVSMARVTFRRLSRLYILALSVIAISIVLSQLFVQSHLNDQLSDSRVINVAGRQRMLSQKLTKELLLLARDTAAGTPVPPVDSIQQTLDTWMFSHRALQQGSDSLGLPGKNSELVRQMFLKLEPHFMAMVTSTKSILTAFLEDSTGRGADVAVYWHQVLQSEPNFLAGMDEIVFQYDKEAKAKVDRLKRTEWLLLLIAFTVLLLELFFIFRPTAFQVRLSVQQLLGAEQEAKKMAGEMEELYKAREQSLQELWALNFGIDQAALFASATIDGKVIHMSEKFRKLLGLEKDKAQGWLAELITVNEGEQQNIQAQFTGMRTGIWTGEIRITTRESKQLWLEMSIVPVNRIGVKQELLILCANITARKEAQMEIDRLNEERFQEQMLQQKLRSAQVIEAQEEERKRIARDIHDGIGQMLTALRFNVQSVDIQNPEKAPAQLSKISELTAQLIKGVRVATFNLTPPELNDYGIASSLSRLAAELNQLTGKKILFENKTNFQGRFDSVIETNLYRIVQEAVNNAIKYAGSSYILITLSHGEHLLSIVVDDDGKGFDLGKLEKRQSPDGTGMGISFMRERVAFINGRLFIFSNEKEGTRITVNMPI